MCVLLIVADYDIAIRPQAGSLGLHEQSPDGARTEEKLVSR
jgi:hypothetical protein